MVKPIPHKEAAKRLNITDRTLRRWTADGYFPRPFKIGGRVYFDESTVQGFIESKALTA